MEVLLGLLGVVTAGAAGTFVVRRPLRPLNDVAQTAHAVAVLPLESGDIGVTERVPERLTDERTEVGQVGSALNALLEHVEVSLAARHRSEQQVRQFVADASHELRTPLATIHGYAELSRRTPDDPAALASALTKVETETDRMSTLVDDLLLLARLDSGRPLDRTEVDVTRLLLESVGDARVLAPGHRWQLRLPDEPVTVTGDEQRLHQVVTNLLSNARHHTPSGTTVTVSADATDDGITITVHDDGPGLSPGLADHVFERFTRGDSSRTRASGAPALGLRVAAIVQAHVRNDLGPVRAGRHHVHGDPSGLGLYDRPVLLERDQQLDALIRVRGGCRVAGRRDRPGRRRGRHRQDEPGAGLRPPTSTGRSGSEPAKPLTTPRPCSLCTTSHTRPADASPP